MKARLPDLTVQLVLSSPEASTFNSGDLGLIWSFRFISLFPNQQEKNEFDVVVPFA